MAGQTAHGKMVVLSLLVLMAMREPASSRQ